MARDNTRFLKKLSRWLPALRHISPRLANKALASAGRLGLICNPMQRRHLEALLATWARQLGCEWNLSEQALALAANLPRWLSRDLVLDGLPDRRFRSLFQVSGFEAFQEAHQRNKGVVLLASHYGSHMLPAHWLLRQGYPTRLYMERPNQISRFLQRHFAEDGPTGQARLFITRREVSSAESAGSILRAIKILKSGMVLCLAGDVRWTGAHTATARFLGQSHSFTATWVVLAAMTGAPVVPVFCRMTPDGGFELAFDDPFTLPPNAHNAASLPNHVQCFLDNLEEQIRRDPSNACEYTRWSDARNTMPSPHFHVPSSTPAQIGNPR